MTLARDLLRAGELTLAQIGVHIGYASPYAFAAAFRRHNGAPPGGTMESVRNDLELVRNDGGLTDGQLELLVDLTRFRNELQHDYIEVSADDAREAVRKLLSNAPKLTRSLNAWLARYDVGV